MSKLSGGQQRRLDVAIALAGNPDLLFLDEPTTGFDPSARHEAWSVVKNLAALGKTVLLTTHYMDEAQYLADRVALVTGGRIVAEGPPASLGEGQLSGRPGCGSASRAARPGPPPPDLAGPTIGPDGVTELVPDDLTLTLNRLTGWAIEHGVSLADLEIVRPSLEDVYLALTGPAGRARAGRGASAARARRHGRRRAS